MLFKKKKKGEFVKNNSYKYGMLGEIYVGKNVKCPRCECKLLRNRTNTPGTDFVCRKGHWFQLKTLNSRRISPNSSEIKLLGGNYKHQLEAILPNGKAADILILLYDKRKNRVDNIKWLKNEKINPNWIIPRKKKKNKNGKEKTECIIHLLVADLLDLEVKMKCLWKKVVKMRREKKITGEILNFRRELKIIQNMTDIEIGEKRKRSYEIMKKYLKSENNRKIVEEKIVGISEGLVDHLDSDDAKDDVKQQEEKEEKEEYFLVDITEQNCSCQWKMSGLCSHLKFFNSNLRGKSRRNGWCGVGSGGVGNGGVKSRNILGKVIKEVILVEEKNGTNNNN